MIPPCACMRKGQFVFSVTKRPLVPDEFYISNRNTYNNRGIYFSCGIFGRSHQSLLKMEFAEGISCLKEQTVTPDLSAALLTFSRRRETVHTGTKQEQTVKAAVRPGTDCPPDGPAGSAPAGDVRVLCQCKVWFKTQCGRFNVWCQLINFIEFWKLV